MATSSLKSVQRQSALRQNVGKLRTKVHLLVAFLTGCFVGPWLQCNSAETTTRNYSDAERPRRPSTSDSSNQQKGRFVQLRDLPFRPTSHTDERGRPILKRQLLDPFVAPRHVGFSVATLGPDQRVSDHAHASLHEFFYVLSSGPSGGTIQVEGINHTVREGSFVHVAPGERHALFADPLDEQPLVFLVSGVVVDDDGDGKNDISNGRPLTPLPSSPMASRNQS